MPHNAYDETPIPARWALHAQNRLESGDITQGITFHQSWSFAPNTLKDPYDMITPNDLKNKFGKDWQPTYADLNDFEKDCKDHWGDELVTLAFPPPPLDVYDLCNSSSLGRRDGVRRCVAAIRFRSIAMGLYIAFVYGLLLKNSLGATRRCAEPINHLDSGWNRIRWVVAFCWTRTV